MSEHLSPSYDLFDDPLRLFNRMLDDIENAQHSIYLETYRFNNDAIGSRFREALYQQAKKGREIKILVDSWGTPGSAAYFSNITANGGELRFFKKIKITFDFFTRNHRRNHRKLLIIDDRIVYIGSANLTAYSFNWKELVLRMDHEIATVFKKVFLENYKRYNKYIYRNIPYSKPLKFKGFEVLRDAPSIIHQRIKKRYETLIKHARRKVVIETPYFLPGFLLRKILMDAAQRGVEVNVIIPHHSDVRMVDILRNKYLGGLHRAHVNILFYEGVNLHAKLLVIDGKLFSLGSANFDYRSFRYMHEITLMGKEKVILQKIEQHINDILKDCVEFDYEKWLRRPMIERVFEWILVPFRHLF